MGGCLNDGDDHSPTRALWCGGVHQVRQQIEIEKDVHGTTAEFLRKLSNRLQEESIKWSQNHDNDLSNRDRDLDVGRGCVCGGGQVVPDG